jgi:prevent-host-death family protein
MKEEAISVTEAARNFSDCINRARYQGTTFVLYKNGVPVARIVPAEPKARTGKEIAAALRDALDGGHLSREKAIAWLKDIKKGRKSLLAPVDKWKS